MTSKERFWKTVGLEEPDHVPVAPYIVYFASKFAGISPSEFGWSVEKTHRALFKTYEYFDKQIDALHILCMRFAYTGVFPSPYSTLYFPWEFPDENLPQFVEKGGRYGPDLYDRILEEGFTTLISPDRIDMERIDKTYGEEAQRHNEWMARWETEDIVNLAGPMTTIPADLLVYARGTEGFLDLLLYEEKIRAVNRLMTPGMVAVNGFLARRANTDIQRLSVQNFAADIVSPQTFENLCWPWMKEMIQAFLAGGYTMVLHLDGHWEPFYHYFQDLPPRRIILELENSDIKEAKKVLGKTLCLKGNVPCTDLAFGSVSQVRDRCRQLIDDCASGGGFVLSSGCEVPVNAEPRNVEAMIDTAITYGRY
jgi:uroporphyrinogen decarboxylase